MSTRPLIPMLVASLAARTVASAAPCGATDGGETAIEVVGDARGTAMIEPLLHGDARDTGPQARVGQADMTACPRLRVRVGWRDGALDITIEDASGVLGERVIGDAAAAAAWIDSWTHPDLASNLLRPRTAPAESRAPTARDSAPTSAAHSHPGFGIDSHGEATLGDDGSRWLGVAAAAHRPLGPVVTGVIARYSSQASSATQGELATTSRWQAETLLAVDLPITGGRTNVALGIAGGGGLVRSSRTASTTTVGPRVEAHAGCSLALGHGVAADVVLAGGAAPGAPTASYRRDGVMYPAEPATVLRLAIGFRMELP
jgi:hypothetical protein